ncbi:MAG: hypothetical protein IKC09_08175 [Oscillospiraceae bacterium]|nr:hypothetical protein [Oscillospiraceae bacterium]
MKIQITQHGNPVITIPFPNWMVLNPVMIKLWLKTGQNYSDKVPNIPPESIDAMCREFRRIKQVHGAWELVHVESSDGDTVTITI